MASQARVNASEIEDDAQIRVQGLQIDERDGSQCCNAGDSDLGSIDQDECFLFTNLPYDIRALIYEVFLGMRTYELHQPDLRRTILPYKDLS